MIAFIFGGLIFLFPLVIYCLVLAFLNSRRQPTMISGPWDFAGVLLATSGFWIVGGPWILAGLHGRWRDALMRGQLTELSADNMLWSLWIITWGGYFVLVLGGACWLLWQRRRVAIVYNCDEETFCEALTMAARRLGLRWHRMGQRFVLDMPGATADTGAADHAALPVSFAGAWGNGATLEQADGRTTAANAARSDTPRSASKAIGLAVEIFPALQNITIHWQFGDAALRQDFEAELGKAFAELEMPPNPVASWFLMIACILFMAILTALVLLLIVAMHQY
ncbi:MAG: hypothetical protein ACK4RK_18255 [Gemmataceae bacterium]